MKNLIKTFVVGAVFIINMPVMAKSIQDIEFAETAEVSGTQLVLNGLGLRKVQRFGLPIKVYVAGLYLEKKSASSDEIIKSETPKLLKMVFVRGVEKAQLQAAWREGMNSNCVPAECEEAKNKLKEFNKLMVDSKNKGTMDIQFLADKVVVDIVGRSKSSGTIEGAVFSRNLLAVFIGNTPPTADFKAGLMGGEAK